MAKKEEKIIISDEELVPSVVGKLDTKEKSPVLLIFIFIVFIGIAFFLPDITNYINKIKNGGFANNTIINPQDKKDNTNDTEEEVIYYDYSTDLVISNNLFSISNIVYNESIISFDMENLTNSVLDLNNTKYFLEIYSSDETLIERIKISYSTLKVGEIKNFSYDLSDGTSKVLSKMLVVNKTEADYPEVTLNSDTDGNANLKCQKGINILTYSFVNNYLVSINDSVNYIFDNTNNYNENLQKYQLMAANNNNLEGVSATVITTEEGFSYTALINLKDADITKLENHNYYAYRTLLKTIKFETESNGYVCTG